MTSPYTVHVDKRVVRELRRLPEEDAERLIVAIERLAKDPRPRGAKKLVDKPGWRIRIGAYRILYAIDDTKHEVYVYRAGHRRFIYN